MATQQELEKARQRLLQIRGQKTQAAQRLGELRGRIELPPTAPLEAPSEGFREIIQRRTRAAEEIADITAFGEQTFARGALQIAGQAAGGVFDIAVKAIGGAARAVTPDPIERLLVSQFNKNRRELERFGTPFQKKALQGAIESYQKFTEENPGAARDIEAIIDLGLLLGIPKAKVPLKAPPTEIGKALITSGERVVETQRQSFIRSLIQPAQTKKVKEAQVARTTEIGRGPFRTSVIEPSARELISEKFITRIPGVKANKTIQGNFNAIQKVNIDEAVKLKAQLEKNDIIFPRQELLARLNQTKETLRRNPALVGDAAKTAEKLIAEIERRIAAAPSKGSDLLQVRKDFDTWVRNQKGKGVFDPTRENAFSVANREIRRSINDFLDEKAVNVGVKESLRRQKALFTAMENIEVKAGIEADTAFKRFFQRTDSLLGTKNRAVQLMAAAIGIGGLGAAATFAGPIAAIGIPAYLTFRGLKLILNPRIRIGLGRALEEIEKQLAKNPGTAERAALIEGRELIKETLRRD